MKTPRPFIAAMFLLSGVAHSWGEVGDGVSEPDSAGMVAEKPDTAAVMMSALTADEEFSPVLRLDELVTAPSPEAWAMTRHNDEAVDHATGTASIQIPLFAWQAGDNQVQLSLTGRVGAFKVDELGGWFGLGWNLEGAGCVTRSIAGLPDECGKFDLRTSQEIEAIYQGYKYLQDIGDNFVDAARDRYSYSCPAGKGSFLVIDGNIVELGISDNVISFTGEEKDGVRDFKVTAPDGTEYLFTEREHLSYRYDSHRIPVNSDLPNYERAVSTWYLSKIVSPEQGGTVRFNYDVLPRWQRVVDHKALSVTGTARAVDRYVTMSGNSPQALSAQSVTTFEDQRILRSVVTDAGRVDFEHQAITYGSKASIPHAATAAILRSNDGMEVSRWEFTNLKSTDGSLLLKSVTKLQDGIIIDQHKLDYYGSTPQKGVDLFGYYNGTVDSEENCPAIDVATGHINEQRAYDFNYACSNALSSHTTSGGVTTNYEYEPATGSYLRVNGEECDTAGYTIGIRLRCVTAKDASTGRVRQRHYRYHDPQSNIDFNCVNYGDYVSVTGMQMVSVTNYDGDGEATQYSTTVTFHDRCRMPGVSVEDAMIYYGAVEEEISGTGIESPVLTRYEFDLSHCRLGFTGGRGNPVLPDMVDIWNRYAHMFSFPTYVSPSLPKALGKIVSGGFIDSPGALPLPKRTVTYRKVGSEYEPLTEKRYMHTVVPEQNIIMSMFQEAFTRDRTEINSTVTHMGSKLSDYNYFNTSVAPIHSRCDSISTTLYYPDGSTRHSGTRLIYTTALEIVGDPLPLFPPISLDSLKVNLDFTEAGSRTPFKADSITMRTERPVLFGTRTTAGGHTMEHYTARVRNVTTEFYRGSATRQTLPVKEMWVVDGRDTITRSYSYGRFNGVTRLTAVELTGRGGALMDRQRITGYSSEGFPSGVKRFGSPEQRFSWDAYGNPTSIKTMSDDDYTLESRFTFKPHVGCTSVTTPDGLTTRYGYTAGRLTEVSNAAGQKVAEYDYTLRCNDTGTGEWVNRITASTLANAPAGGGGGTMARKSEYYDGFGLKVLSVMEDYGSMGNVVSATRYDALHRAVRSWVPLPSSATVESMMHYDSELKASSQTLYGDGTGYSTITYPASGEEYAAVTTMPGEDFAGAVTLQERSCSATEVGDADRAVMRYSFDGARLRCEGYYGAGELECMTITDPDGNLTLTFTDVLGRTVLVRRVDGTSGYADTYTVSDSWGNPLIVLPPLASEQLKGTGREWSVGDKNIERYAFIYSYDRALRQRSVKLPGCEPTEYAYDGEGVLAYSRNGRQRARGVRTFRLLDPLGREAVTGECRDELSEDIWTASTGAVATRPVVKRSATAGEGLLATGYTVVPGTGSEPVEARLLTATYYDDGGFLPSSGVRSRFPGLRPPGGEIYPDSLPLLEQVRPRSNRVTGTLTAVLHDVGAPTWAERVLTTIEYDALGQPCGGTVYYGDSLRVTTAMTNTVGGLPLTLEQTLMRGDSLVSRYAQTNAYDPFGRLTSSQLDTPAGGEKQLYTAEFSATGEPETEWIDWMQRTTYRNIRGAVEYWSTPFLSQELMYGSQGAVSSYSGRVTARINRRADGLTRRYDYTYSPLGFLTEAKFSSSYAALGFSCSYTYDRQGNILTSCQESQPYNTLLFTMGYTYEGNQLLSIDRVLPGALPYEPLSVSDFTERGKFEPVEEVPLAKRNLYDANGNLVYDRGRGLTIDYNLIERPERIVTQSGDTVYYVYTATGEKLSEIYRSRDGLSDLRRDFAGVHEMTDGRFTQLNLQQGYIDSIGTLHIYVPDFQGNVIGVVNSRTHQLEQQTDYYPYGQPHPDALGAEIQRRKYGGKELLTELGLDEYDFSARRLAPCGSFTQPDPKATKYPWLSPYAYCAGDPINYVDPTGERLFFRGEEFTVNRGLDVLNEAMEYRCFKMNFEGKIEISEGVTASMFEGSAYALYQTLSRVIEDENIDVTMNIVMNDDDVCIGEAEIATVDIGDAEILAKSGLTTTEGVLLHEINEQYVWKKALSKGADSNTSLGDAHHSSIKRESLVNKINYFLESDEKGILEPVTHKFVDGMFRIVVDNGATLQVYMIDVSTGTIKSNKTMKNPMQK